MTIRFSFFNHGFDNVPQMCQEPDWASFVDKMKALSEVTAYKPIMGEFDKQETLISSGIYNDPTATRSNKTVDAWDMVILDIDKGIKSFGEVKRRLEPFKYLIYSTANCTDEYLKIRVVIPLHTTAPAKVLHQLWNACDEWMFGLVDPQTKDMSRMHYRCGRYTNKGMEYNHIFEYQLDGLDLDWEMILKRFPSPPPEERFKIVDPLSSLKRAVYNNANGSPNFDIMCPESIFVNRYMREKYALTPMGAHHKALYVFALQCCANAAKNNYPLSHSELVDMLQQLDELDGGFYDLNKLSNTAKDALEYSCM